MTRRWSDGAPRFDAAIDGSMLQVLERHVGPRAAVAALRSWTSAHELEWDVEVLWTGAAAAGSPPSVVRAALLSGGAVVGEGMGKGLGEQALASALFEALEDLAVEGRLPVAGNSDATDPTRVRQVPADTLSSYLASMDAAIRLLRQEARSIGIVDLRPVPEGLWATEPTSTEPFPAALADVMYVPEGSRAERLASRYSSSNGIAAGLSPWDAVLHAMNEVNERDAVGAFLVDVMAERPHGQMLEPSEPMRSLVSTLSDEFGTAVHLRRLHSVWDHVVLAVGSMRDGRGCAIVGSGCSSNPAYAAQRAVVELAQNLVVEREGEPLQVDGLLPSLDRLRPFPNLLRAAALDRLPPPQGTAPLLGSVDGCVVDVEAEVRHRSIHLRRAGFSPFARPLLTTTSGRALSPQVWQVVIPGFERFHLVRAGLPVEPTGRLRTQAALDLARASTPHVGGQTACKPTSLWTRGN